MLVTNRRVKLATDDLGDGPLQRVVNLHNDPRLDEGFTDLL